VAGWSGAADQLASGGNRPIGYFGWPRSGVRLILLNLVSLGHVRD